MFARLRNRKGVSMVEYALLAGLIALALIGAITALRGGVAGVFQDVADELNDAPGG
jgi:pilus assembly protein Flp/PilA